MANLFKRPAEMYNRYMNYYLKVGCSALVRLHPRKRLGWQPVDAPCAQLPV